MNLDNLKDWVNENASKAIGVPAALSALTFFGNLALALSDGVITQQEFHNLIASANGLESLVLIVLMIFLKKKKY